MNLMNTKTIEIALALLAAALLLTARAELAPSADGTAQATRAACDWTRPVQKSGTTPRLVPGCPTQGVL